MSPIVRSPAQWLRAAIVTALVFGGFHAIGAQTPKENWVGTWATASAWRQSGSAGSADRPQSSAPQNPAAGASASSSIPPPIVPVDISNQTLRQIVHTSIGGRRVRVVFTNVFGTEPFAIGGAHVALRLKDAAIAPKSGWPLLFSGQSSATIPPGAILVSDAVDLQVPPLSDLAIDLFVPTNMAQSRSPITLHNRGYQTNYLSTPGNHAGAENLPVATTTPIWHWLARVEVAAEADASAVVAFGDSITDGYGSPIDGNARWPDELARRLAANASTRNVAVLNAGIGGNRLLSESTSGFGAAALARFDRDVLAQPGASYVVVLEGINDISGAREGSGFSAETLIAAHRQLIARARARGLTIYGAMLTPAEGRNGHSAEREKVRSGLNNWMRTSGEYDAVVDFDAAVRDPHRPARFLETFHAGDYLHPNAAGYKAMAAAFDLKLFERRKR